MLHNIATTGKTHPSRCFIDSWYLLLEGFRKDENVLWLFFWYKKTMWEKFIVSIFPSCTSVHTLNTHLYSLSAALGWQYITNQIAPPTISQNSKVPKYSVQKYILSKIQMQIQKYTSVFPLCRARMAIYHQPSCTSHNFEQFKTSKICCPKIHTFQNTNTNSKIHTCILSLLC